MNKQPFYRVGYSQCREVSFARVNRNRIHRHAYFEPCIVISGRGQFEHGGRSFELQAGDLFIADPDIYHEIRSPVTRDLQIYFFGFYITRHLDDRRVSRQASLNQTAINSFVAGHAHHSGGQSHIAPLFEHAMRLMRKHPVFPNSRYYHETSVLLINQIVDALSGLEFEIDHSEQSRHNRIVDFIEKNLHQPLKVGNIAGMCGMSERTLRRKWKQYSQHSLSEEIARRRVERACQLLLLQDIPIAEVGEHVGVRDPAQFSRLFKRVKGLSPGIYRRQHHENDPDTVLTREPFRTENRKSPPGFTDPG